MDCWEAKILKGILFTHCNSSFHGWRVLHSADWGSHISAFLLRSVFKLFKLGRLDSHGSLGGMDQELNEHGDLLINGDELVKSERLESTVDISEGKEGDEELFGEDRNLEIKEEAMDDIEGEDLIENGQLGGDQADQGGEGGGDQG